MARRRRAAPCGAMRRPAATSIPSPSTGTDATCRPLATSTARRPGWPGFSIQRRIAGIEQQAAGEIERLADAADHQHVIRIAGDAARLAEIMRDRGAQIGMPAGIAADRQLRRWPPPAARQQPRPQVEREARHIRHARWRSSRASVHRRRGRATHRPRSPSVACRAFRCAAPASAMATTGGGAAIGRSSATNTPERWRSSRNPSLASWS